MIGKPLLRRGMKKQHVLEPRASQKSLPTEHLLQRHSSQGDP